jgi:hypothetical protein
MTNSLGPGAGGVMRLRLTRQPTYVVVPRSAAPALLKSLAAALHALDS